MEINFCPKCQTGDDESFIFRAECGTKVFLSKITSSAGIVLPDGLSLACDESLQKKGSE